MIKNMKLTDLVGMSLEKAYEVYNVLGYAPQIRDGKLKGIKIEEVK